MDEKPRVDVELSFDVPDGVAECYAADGRFLGRFAPPDKPPVETRRMMLPPDVYFSLMPPRKGPRAA